MGKLGGGGGGGSVLGLSAASLGNEIQARPLIIGALVDVVDSYVDV